MFIRKDSLHSLSRLPTEPFSFQESNIHLNVTLRPSLDRRVLHLTIFSALMSMLALWGGATLTIVVTASILFQIYNYNQLVNGMVSQLFVMKRSDKEMNSEENIWDQVDRLDTPTRPNCGEWCCFG